MSGSTWCQHSTQAHVRGGQLRVDEEQRRRQVRDQLRRERSSKRRLRIERQLGLLPDLQTRDSKLTSISHLKIWLRRSLMFSQLGKESLLTITFVFDSVNQDLLLINNQNGKFNRDLFNYLLVNSRRYATRNLFPFFQEKLSKKYISWCGESKAAAWCCALGLIRHSSQAVIFNWELV